MSSHRPLSPRRIISLLAQFQPTSKGYPPALLAARRSEYLKQAARTPIAPGVLSGKAFKNIYKNIPTGITSTLEGVLQTVLALMVAGLVVTAAIVYREEIVDLFAPGAGGAVSSEVAPMPFESEPSPTSISLTPTATDRLYYAATPTASLTPTPDGSPIDDGGSGKKLGQTPTPPGQRSPQKP